MLTQTYDIYFSGQILDGNDPAETRIQVGRLFKADHNQLKKLFSGTPVKIRSGVDEETATKYRVTLRKVGALIEIKPSNVATDSKENIDANEAHPDTSEELTLLPPNTGSLIDCAPTIIPQPLPEIDHLSLASAGSIIDESPTPEPPQIDTNGLTISPAHSGTLEDYKKEVEPYPIPDITHLDLDEP
jgi:hypothetical protein